MPRPRKCRKVCAMPKTCEFSPTGDSVEFITMTVDEYEAIRLIDKDGVSQEECAVYMQVGRTTAQQIYNRAKNKVATALVDGLGIRIEGGDYRICEGRDVHFRCPRDNGICHREPQVDKVNLRTPVRESLTKKEGEP